MSFPSVGSLATDPIVVSGIARREAQPVAGVVGWGGPDQDHP
jgi:hypothetical protein